MTETKQTGWEDELWERICDAATRRLIECHFPITEWPEGLDSLIEDLTRLRSALALARGEQT